MITLTILCMIYTFFGFRRFKKLYGNYNIFDESMKLWTLALAMSAFYFFIMTIVFCVTYLP
jgi:hypothetical protein